MPIRSAWCLWKVLAPMWRPAPSDNFFRCSPISFCETAALLTTLNLPVLTTVLFESELKISDRPCRFRGRHHEQCSSNEQSIIHRACRATPKYSAGSAARNVLNSTLPHNSSCCRAITTFNLYRGGL